MWVRLPLWAALGVDLSACAQPTAPPRPEPIWMRDSHGTSIHRPSGLSMPQQVRQFDLTKSFIPGESNDNRFGPPPPSGLQFRPRAEASEAQPPTTEG